MKTFEELLETAGELAIRFPDDRLVRRHHGDVLVATSKYEEAETVYRAILSESGLDQEITLGLSQALLGQRKYAEALAVVEKLLHVPDPAPRAYVVHAHLLLITGESLRAAEQYRAGVAIDAHVKDHAMEMILAQDPKAFDLMTSRAQYSESPSDASCDANTITLDESENGDHRPIMTFSDVGGMDDVKEEIRLKLLYPLQHPEIYKKYGKRTGGGVLMYGPPGCGKTLFARATAGESNAAFVNLAITDVLEKYYGDTEKQLHQCFERARESAPCVLFIDEVDAMGANREDFDNGDSRRWVNQLLTEMDGVSTGNDGVLILAATNAPWHVDPALRRPGRFDRMIYVPAPDFKARTEIIEISLRGKPIQNIDYAAIAKRTGGFSGADLAAVIDLAVERKIKQAMASGVTDPLTTEDLVDAIPRHQPSTSEWLTVAREHVRQANGALSLEIGSWNASLN